MRMATPKQTAAEKWALPVQQERSRVTRERLLAAAEKVFAEKGYDGATMSEVAARAGAQIGSLYRFFPNKDILANALIERFHVRVAEIFDSIDGKARPLSPEALADALLNVLGDRK